MNFYYCLLFWVVLLIQIRIITSVSIRDANKECIDLLVHTHFQRNIHNVFGIVYLAVIVVYIHTTNYMGDGEEILCCRSMIIQSETVFSILLLSRVFSLILSPCAIS